MTVYQGMRNAIIRTPPSYPDDEIDLFELAENLWKQKLLIALVTLIVTAAGVGYALLATPVYQASAYLLEPTVANVKPLTSLPLYKEVISESLLEDLAIQLNLPRFREDFVKDAGSNTELLYTGDTLVERLDALNKRLAITPRKEKEQEENLFPYTVTFNAPSPSQAVAELNRFVTSASESLVREMAERYELAVDNEQKRIQQRIDLLEGKMREERMNKIVRLQEEHELKLKELTDELAERRQYYEAKLQGQDQIPGRSYSIANSLNITEPVGLNQFSKASSGRVEVIADISNRPDPLYLRGTRLLGAELEQLRARPDDYYPDDRIRELEAKIAYMDHNRTIETLLARKSDHPFSEEIRDLKTRMVTLEAEKFPDDIRINFMPSSAAASPAPIKPKKLLIVALSVILGGMAGVMIALVRSAIRNRRQQPTM